MNSLLRAGANERIVSMAGSEARDVVGIDRTWGSAAEEGRLNEYDIARVSELLANASGR